MEAWLLSYRGGASIFASLPARDTVRPFAASYRATMAVARGLFLRLLLVLLSLAAVGAEADPSWAPADELLAAGAESYARGDWRAVILHMERALRAREAHGARLVHCRQRCAANCTADGAWPRSTEQEEQPPPAVGERRPLDDLRFFGQLLRRAACLRRCLPDGVSRYQLGEETELEFQKRSPYNYLQVAYFKIHKLDKAVAAAHTFFAANPDHVEMRQNLEYYQMMAGVKDSDFVDLEAKPHMQEFRLGVSYYTEEKPQAAILHLEKALESYWVASTECRALCEGAYDYEGYNYLEYNADLFQAIIDHYTQVLSCKQVCATELASQAGHEKPIEEFLPSHFNYLQFAYYNSGNYEKAIECAQTYLLFFPNDEVMNQNLAYYTAVLGENLAKPIHPRKEVHLYQRRSLLEKEHLYFAYDVFGIPFVDPDTWTPEEVIPKRLREKQKAERETAARISEEIGNLMKEIETLVVEKTKESTDMSKLVREGGPLVYDGLSVTMNSKLLNGSQRVVVDGVLSEEECTALQSLTNAAASAGDGYRGKTSPHTPAETFYGVTVYKALKLGQEGKVPMHSAYLYYNVTEKVRRVMESYFRLDAPLHFSYSHLVCRTAIEDKQEDRADPSHPVHVDNCILNAEALVCVKEPPAYTFRDYSAILYLNGDFEGGAFYFTELDATTVTAEVQPQCGRAVGFSSGSENPHGVKAVTKGQRCAIALWFTLDPRHGERERVQADDLVRMLFSTEEAELPPDQAPVTEKPTPAPTKEPERDAAVGKDEL
ncbi:prolyl 3-hydroxylase 1 isoform X2 [Rhineura floridana]|uniref:prolyl 3-hydroxylase 1 isoform X2 n=1 Tax=Rhineura floridana TaxID=261503 RepID=UPI002AC869F1|nr:prolyl 3-hydroxylase 1 isoform X2 [Rhineura floridana]